MVKKSNKLLILDLDEPLIHISETKLNYAEYFLIGKHYL